MEEPMFVRPVKTKNGLVKAENGKLNIDSNTDMELL